MRAMLLVVLAIGLAGCGNTPAGQQTVQQAVVLGQLFCAASPGLVVALGDAGADGKAISVIGKTAATVDMLCGLIRGGGRPVSPPPDPGAAPKVAVVVPARLQDGTKQGMPGGKS